MILYIDKAHIENRKVFLRVDFNVTLTKEMSIADDARIKQSLPTIEYLLKRGNKLILASHLGRPDKRDPKYSLKKVADHLQGLLPKKYSVHLIDDYNKKEDKAFLENQKPSQIAMLENLRFYSGENKNDPEYAKGLANLADVFVNDAFGVCHRVSATTVGITEYLPSYGGLLLEREIEMISHVLRHPQKPFVAIIGGAKITGKLELLYKLTEIADHLILGGGIANTFLLAEGFEVGKSLVEKDQLENAKKIMKHAKEKGTEIMLLEDVAVGEKDNTENGGSVKKVEEIVKNDVILDIGPETQARIGKIILEAKTLVWNGPVGYIENPQFKRGTDFLYYAITQNAGVTSIVGGGDTLAAISRKEYLDQITHISTGGGAMLEFIEKGSLPGIDALEK